MAGIGAKWVFDKLPGSVELTDEFFGDFPPPEGFMDALTLSDIPWLEKTYAGLKGSKGIDLISNNQLKKDILNLYNIDYYMLVYEYENFHKNIHDYGRPIARSLFKTTNNNSEQLPELQPVDYKSLRSNVVLINTLKIIISNDRRIHEMLRDLIKECQEIKNAIDVELKK